VKKELEDLSFVYFDPVRYKQVREMVDGDERLKGEFVSQMEEEIVKRSEGFGLNVVVEHQVGGYWEIAEKQKRRGIRGGRSKAV
jgi:(p)ppGpp synthase/HD superfamily hydrolase